MERKGYRYLLLIIILVMIVVAIWAILMNRKNSEYIDGTLVLIAEPNIARLEENETWTRLFI